MIVYKIIEREKQKINFLRIGFTLTESLLVISILIILAVATFPAFRLFQRDSELSSSAEEIMAILNLAQSKTLASEGASQWGVYFEATNNQYVLFKGIDYDLRDNSFDEIYNIPQSVEIYEVDLDGEDKVFFSKITGFTEQFGSISLRLKNDFTKNKIIYLEKTGKASLSSPVFFLDNDRIKDSRHLHFDLGWSIQDAASLNFQFMEPDPNQIETVSMAQFFNMDKTEFSWDNKNNPFIVNGNEQVFEIHTHFLDSSNVILCIHRDRNYEKNDKEVVIYIVDGGINKNIVHYLADAEDTAEKGFYVFNSMERQ